MPQAGELRALARAFKGSFRQQWKQTFSLGDSIQPIITALGPALVAGWIVGKSGNPVAVSYVFVGSALMAIWTFGVFYTGWSLAVEHAQGTLDLILTTRTPLTVVLFGKVLAIMAYMLPSALVSFLVVLALSGNTTTVERPLLLAVSTALALISVVVICYIFAPFGFLVGARGGFFNAFMPLGTVLSGFLYPIANLPLGLEAVARILPSGWAMQAVVASVNGQESTQTIQLYWLLSILLVAAFVALAVLLFQRVEMRVRFTGNLGRY